MVWTWIWRKFSFQDKPFGRNLKTLHFCLSSNHLGMSMGLYQIYVVSVLQYDLDSYKFWRNNLLRFYHGPSNLLFETYSLHVSHFFFALFRPPGCRNLHVPPAFFRLRSILYPKSNPCAAFMWKGPGIPLGRPFDGKTQGDVPTMWNFCPKRNASKTHLSFAVDCYLQPLSFTYFLVTYGMSGAPINGWKKMGFTGVITLTNGIVTQFIPGHEAHPVGDTT